MTCPDDLDRQPIQSTSSSYCAQLYHQFHTPTEALSSFQRWKLEEDLKFYATFPQARPAANQYTFQPPQYGDYFGGAGFEFNSGVSYAPDDAAGNCCPSTNSQPSPVMSRGEEIKSSLSPALHYDYGPLSDNSAVSLPSPVYNVQASQSVSPTSPMRHSALPDIPVTASQPYHSHAPLTEVQSPIIVPSQQPSHSPQHHPQPEPPIMDFLPSPSSPAPPSHIPVAHQITFDAPRESPSNQWRLDQVDTPWQYEPLPPSSVIRPDDPPFSSRPLQGAFYPTVRSQSYPQSHPSRHNIRSNGWPMVRTPSPHIPLSPLPSKRQAEKKPPLACLFCRGRKIACGPPDPGSLDPTCNQCHRRSIKCEYPSESRRGMRRKNSVGGATIAGAKVKPGKRSRSGG